MNKKILLLTSLLTTSLHATPFNGFYIGVIGGGTMRDIDYKLTPISEEAKYIMSTYKKDYTKYGFLLGALTGYGKTFDSYYIGGEGSVHYENANSWQNHSINLNNFVNANTLQPTTIKLNFKTQYKRDLVFGLGIRLGLLAPKNTLVYIKPAIEFSKDKLISRSVSVSGPGGTAATDADEISVSKWKIKLSPGIGIEHYFTNNISARLEYAYSFGLNNSLKEKPSINKDDVISEAKLTSHSLKLGVSYTF